MPESSIRQAAQLVERSILERAFAQFSQARVLKPLGGVVCIVGLVLLLMDLSADEEFEQDTWSGFWVPLIMSFFAGLSTTIGGLVIFFMGESPSDHSMAWVLGLAAGVMIAVCIFDFWLPAARHAWQDGDISEMLYRAVWTGFGVLLFLALSYFLESHGHSQEEITQRAALHGTSSNVRGDVEANHDHEDSDTVSLDREDDDETVLLPNEATLSAELKEKKWRLALLMMITLTAHNFPEGAAVAFSALESRRLGCVVVMYACSA